MTDIYKLFEEEIWKPEDYTRFYWYEEPWMIGWSDESGPPDEWEESYSTERVRHVTERGGYRIVTLDDGCGGQYQAIFDLNKKLET